MKTLILLLGCLLILYAQEGDLPQYGDITELKGLQRVYLIADSTDARKLILKELQKYPVLSVVNSPNNADFILEYKVIQHGTTPIAGVIIPPDTSEMTAYVLKEKRRRVLWSKTENGGFRANEINLTRNFIKAIKKVTTEKK